MKTEQIHEEEEEQTRTKNNRMNVIEIIVINHTVNKKIRRRRRRRRRTTTTAKEERQRDYMRLNIIKQSNKKIRFLLVDFFIATDTYDRNERSPNRFPCVCELNEQAKKKTN